MRFSFIFSFIFLLSIAPSFAQDTFSIKGTVRDSSSGTGLPGVSVFTSDQSVGALTDLQGNFVLKLKKGSYTLTTYYFGYKSNERKIEVNANLEVNFSLSSEAHRMNAVVLKGKRPDENVQNTKMSAIDLNIEQIKKLPALFGEVDVVKNLQMLPGVQTAGEGSTGLFVRGGGADQNLVLFDYATVYNPVHAVGIFSIFNSDVIGSAELSKGGISAAYGGRLSSLVDIRTKTPNMEKLAVSGGIGILASRLMIEAPIVKDKAAVFVSARRTYFDTFLKFSQNKDLHKTKLYFLDLNGKASFKFDKKNTLNISGYLGSDVIGLSDLFANTYGNDAATIDYKHVFNENFYAQTILTYSGFDFNVSIGQEAQEMKISNGVKEHTLRQSFTFEPNAKNIISLGFDVSYKAYFPGEITPQSVTSVFSHFKVQNGYSADGALFIANKQKITHRLSADYGIRFSLFDQLGAADVYQYSSALPTVKTLTDTISYGANKSVKTYVGLAPRLAVRYMLNESSSVKASYNRMFQYLHLLSNSTSPVPSNIWMPSGTYLKPEKADQIALGYFRNFKENTYETSVEGYYKKMYNVPDFIDNAAILFNTHPETDIRAGDATAYGAEFFIRKLKGKTTGWISYTLSKVTKKIEGINGGEAYPASWDRRHNLNIVLLHELSKKVSLSATFIYASGSPYTLPASKYNFDYMSVSYYTSRNGYRLRDYNRLDLGIVLNFNKEGKFKSNLNISVYNVYGRKNPYTVLVRDADPDNGQSGKELAMIYLFRWLPSITYNFNF